MTDSVIFDARAMREVLASLPDVPAWEWLTPPELSEVYLPKNHIKALNPEVSIVVGMRGSGKSFWTAVLSSEQPAHQHLRKVLFGHTWKSEVQVRVGYGLSEEESSFPSARVLATLLKKQVDPFVIWQTVLLQHLLAVCAMDVPWKGGWSESTAWCAGHPEEVNRLLAQCDQLLQAQNKTLLVLFDALDRLGSEWPVIRELLRGALRLCLSCRSRRMIRLKFFLRPDMEEDPEIWTFQDSSKLKASGVELQWGKGDLYGLIFHGIGNSPESIGQTFRQQTSITPWTCREGVYIVPDPLVRDEQRQKEIMARIADTYMGSNSRRGYAYTWIPTHLADAMGRVSPRSFLLAFKKAAEVTEERRANHRLALHYESIQQGVVQASRTRVNEIKEDYPWIKPILDACRGLSVPSDSKEFTRYWDEQSLQSVAEEGNTKLPPRRFTFDSVRLRRTDALLDDLVELAVIYRTEDGRINMPDIFRVEFGIKRKGGVKPPR
ncbi:MAG: hypothetical protein H7836_11200, partial [Magnetococcus sp. YQC-3]